MRFFSLSFGVVLCLLGLQIIITARIYNFVSDHTFDVSNIKWPLGILFIIFGGVWIWLGIRSQGTAYYICPKCKTPFNAADVPDKLCPECHEPLEDLKGFYRKHPKERK